MKGIMIPLLAFLMLIANMAVVHAAPPPYAAQGIVNLTPSTTLLTAVDPYAKPDRPNPLNPERPYWYVVDQKGLKVMQLGTNTVLGSVDWPLEYDLAQPNGSMQIVAAPLAGWEPKSLMVPFPDGEGIGPEAVSGADTLAFVVMAHSGYEWQSSEKPAGIPRNRDTIAPMSSADTESSLLLMVDVSDPTNPVIHAGALLGHEAGQMAWDPGAGTMYVANMPSKSLPAELESFISKIIPPETGAEPAPPYSPNTFYPLCGPEIQWSGEVKVAEKMGIPVNEPEVWACDAIHGAGEGEGPFTYKFEGLPTWLTANALDPATGEGDGILYGTPVAVGTYSFKVTVTDHSPEADGINAPKTASAVFTIEVKPSVTEFAAGEMEVEAGITTALPLWGTGTCDIVPGTTPVPPWFNMMTVPFGCIALMNNPPLQGEYYNFKLPYLTRFDTRTGMAYPGPWELSAEVLGTYGFDSLPAGVGLTGLAWHEVDMIPGEPDKYVLNSEFIGVSPEGQLYHDVLPYEETDTIEEVGPPSMVIKTNKVTTLGAPLTGTGFGNLVAEADGDIFVAADDAVIKVTVTPGTPATDTTPGTPSTISTINTISLPGAKGSYLALDSDLEPAVKPELGGAGQIDHNALWVTSPTNGNAFIIDTTAGAVAQTLAVPNASSLGGAAIDSVSNGLAYLAVPSQGTVNIFGSGSAWNSAPLIAAINPAEALVDPTIMTVGSPGLVTVIATGWPIPALTVSGSVPGLTFTDNGNGTLTVAGTPSAAGTYPLTATATNVVGSTSQAFTVTVNPRTPPAITSTSVATLLAKTASQFKVEATGTPTPILTVEGNLPAGVTFHDNAACSPAIPAGNCTGSAFLGGLPTVTGMYPLTITATNSEGTVSQPFVLYVTDYLQTVMAPAVTTQPLSQTLAAGETATFIANATGTPAPTIQWQVLSTGPDATWNDISNATGTNYTTGVVTTAMEGYQYRAVFTVPGASIYSTNATLHVADPAPAISSASDATFLIGTNGSFTATATGKPTPTLSYTGTLPEGITFVPGDGDATLAGTANAPGTYSITITATNALGSVAQNFTLKVQDMAVATTSLPSGWTGLAYSQQLTVEGGTGPYTWTMASNNFLPSGLELSSSGKISGTPGKEGSYTFTVQVQDSQGHRATRSMLLVVEEKARSIKVSLEAGSEPEGIAVNPVTHKAYILSRDLATGTKNVVVMDGSVLNSKQAPKKLRMHQHSDALQAPKLIRIANDHEYLAIDSTRNLIYVPTKYAIPVVDETGEPPEEGDEPASEVMGTLTVIDGDTNSVVAAYEFPRGVMPEGVSVDPVNNVVYIAVKLPEPGDPGYCPVDPVSGEAECEVSGGMIYAFNAANVRTGSLGSPVAEFAAEEPESVVFDPVNRLLYAADESKGTTTIVKAVDANGLQEANLKMQLPIFSTPGFLVSGPNPYSLPCSPYEADKMAVGNDGSVYITDDKSRVAKIKATKVVGMTQIDLLGENNSALYCYGEEPLQGLNTANNIGFLQSENNPAKLYVVSEQNTVSVLDPDTLNLKSTITIPFAVHLDGIAVDPSANRVWITDEVGPSGTDAGGAVYVLHGSYTGRTRAHLDFNDDGKVDMKDYDLMLAEIRKPTAKDPAYDVNQDGAVNLLDARVMYNALRSM